MLLTKSDPTVDSRLTSNLQYKFFLRYFAPRFCVAVTLGVILLAAVEFCSYLRYLSKATDTLEPWVKLELAQAGSDSEREYWKEFVQASKVTYHPYVLWRRPPYPGGVLSINGEGTRGPRHPQGETKTSLY